jgi:hypothetical protein
VNPYQWLVEVCEPPFLLEPLAVAQFSLSRFRPDGDRDDASERQGRRVDTALVLKSVEALADPSDVRALQGRARSDRLLHDGVDMVEQLDAGGSMDALELSLGVLSAAGEFRVFVEPALAEPGLAFEFSDVSLGSGDLAIEVLGDGLGVGSPLLFGESLGSDGRPVDATPAIPLPSSYDRSVHQEVGVLTLAAGLVELAGSAACEGVLPAAGAAGEVLAISAQSVEIPACRTELRHHVGRGVAFECFKLGDEPGPSCLGIFGQRPDRAIDAYSGGAGAQQRERLVGRVELVAVVCQFEAVVPHALCRL